MASQSGQEARGEDWRGPPPSKVKQPRARRQGGELHHGSVRRSASAGTASKHWGRGDLQAQRLRGGAWSLSPVAQACASPTPPHIQMLPLGGLHHFQKVGKKPELTLIWEPEDLEQEPVKQVR